ncbi:hypothetical protein EDWATA_01844 [Edwardsiella tarda ATCC 23685]|uniref:Uncharacterized protein n=1 Tax=Edwardsiella tarda ATCC 23685 TaxID=500638 RepID=D4F516_EDWTA|nr:hypothetical protein EDWATA_01844 [Edwardsiella tarda ATCC 23685]
MNDCRANYNNSFKKVYLLSFLLFFPTYRLCTPGENYILISSIVSHIDKKMLLRRDNRRLAGK